MAKLPQIDEIQKEVSESEAGPSADELEEFDENSPELIAQIREGYQEYLRGELKPVDEFMDEIEAELED